MIPAVSRQVYEADRARFNRVRDLALRLGLPERYVRTPEEVESLTPGAQAFEVPVGSYPNAIRYVFDDVAAAENFRKAAALGLAAEPKADPKGIGRKAPTTPLDLALLIKTGAMSASPAPFCPHRLPWDWCPLCNH